MIERLERIKASWKEREGVRGHIEGLDVDWLIGQAELAEELIIENRTIREEFADDSIKYRKIIDLYFKGDDYQIINFLRDVKTIITGIEQPKPLKIMK